MTQRKPAKTQVRYASYMMDAMRRLEWDLHNTIGLAGRIPTAWHQIAKDRSPGKKQRITLRVEADVVKFFKSMGEGYQSRMNDVLAAWMHGRLAGVIEGAETRDEFKWEWAAEEEKPGWGETEAILKRE